MTGSEGRNSVEQRGANTVSSMVGSSSGSSGGFCRACAASDDGHPSENGAQMKNASARASPEPTVSVAHLAAAITTAASMGIREKERVCDRIYATQPNLLGSVLAQRSLGVSMPTIDFLLNILIVLYLAIEESGQVLAVVSEADQERELQHFTAAVRFTEGLGSDAPAQSIEQTIRYKREKFLFAYVVDILQRARLMDLRNETSKYPILIAINLINCIATARRITP
jgi:hypothetical protein